MKNNDITVAGALGEKYDQRGFASDRKQKIGRLIQQVIARAKNIPTTQLSKWDERSIAQAVELAAAAELSELRREISELMALAGTNYELEKSKFLKH